MKFLFFIILILLSGCGSNHKISYEFSFSEDKVVKLPEIIKRKSKYEALKNVDFARDPFLSLEEQGLQVSEELEEITQPKISAIIYSPVQKLVIIEGQILKIGDVVDSKEIVKIEPESIVLKEGGKLYLLKLTDVVKFREEGIKTVPENKSISKDEKDISQENELFK